MDSTRWKLVQSLFHDAAELPENRRDAFLKSACTEDASLLADVEAMLQEDARAASLLDASLAELARAVVDGASGPGFAVREFGPYRIQRLLGEGGMGVVYFAERPDLGSVAAIKILRDGGLSPARSERFLSEQRTLAHLNHPSIARLYDADTLADGTPWFAMEYVDGEPLTQYCAKNELRLEERLRLFRSVCEAVQYAHGQAVIHRDLKPSNILVKPDGSVRLLDFGIAKQLDTLAETANQTRTGLRLMTPAYAAPEQIRGERLGVYTDVYALGVILYELLAGRLPFDLSNCTSGQAADLVMEGEPEKPSTHKSIPAGKSAWADLDVLCMTAMHKDPARRYRSAEALTRDIDHFLNGEPLEARPDSAGYRLGKFVGRHRASLSVGVLALAIIITLTAVFTWKLAAARNRAVAEVARTQRIQQFMLSLFGDESAGPSGTLRVVALLDRGVQEARSLDREPEVQAGLYDTLGEIYQKLGRLDEAEGLLNSALERRKAMYGTEHREVADSLVALGLLRVRQGRLEDADWLVRDGLAMSRRLLPPDDPDVARAISASGKVLEHRGAYSKALVLLQQAARMQERPGVPPPDLADTLNELADTQFYLGQYAVSDSLNRRVMAMHRQIYGARHPLVADDLINLSAIQFMLGHYGEAAGFARQALDINQAWYGNEHPEVASSLIQLGQALGSGRHFDEAGEVLARALAIQERVYGPSHPRVALALNELGRVELQAGKPELAEARFRRAVDIYRAANGDKHFTVAVAMANIAGVYMQRKQYGRAEQVLREVIERLTAALPADHPHLAIARIRLGRALVLQHRYQEAEALILAGYQVLMKQNSRSVVWLEWAREDLATVYDALHESDKAARFRAELAHSGPA